jgi:hypothetical protein
MSDILLEDVFGEIGELAGWVLESPTGEVQQVESIGSQRAWGAAEQALGIQEAVGPGDLLAPFIEQAVRGRAVAGGWQMGDGEFHKQGQAF